MQYTGVWLTTVVSQTHTSKVKALISHNEPKSLITRSFNWVIKGYKCISQRTLFNLISGFFQFISGSKAYIHFPYDENETVTHLDEWTLSLDLFGIELEE